MNSPEEDVKPIGGMKMFPASYSRLSTYERCAAAAGYKYVMKVPYKKSEKAARGTEIHGSIEAVLLGQSADLHPAARTISAVISEVKEKAPLVEFKLAFSRHFEAVVDWRSSDAWFRMVLDAGYLDGKVAYIPEWKSGKVWDDHKDQRRLYAIGALAQWPEAETAMVTTYYLDQGKKVSVLVDRPQGTMLVGQFNERLEKMENERHFAPRPGNYCRWCDFSRYRGGPCRVG